MIKLALTLYIFILCCGAFSALVTFIIDVIKWHSMERKENIINSADLYYGKGGVIRGRADNYNNAGRGTGDNDNNDNGTGRGDNDNELQQSDNFVFDLGT